MFYQFQTKTFSSLSPTFKFDLKFYGTFFFSFFPMHLKIHFSESLSDPFYLEFMNRESQVCWNVRETEHSFLSKSNGGNGFPLFHMYNFALNSSTIFLRKHDLKIPFSTHIPGNSKPKICSEQY